jgi:hypothetical protein
LVEVLMDAQLKARWVEALRSGEYTQERYSIGNKRRGCLCCLGVGAVVAKPSIDLQSTDDAVRLLFGDAGWDESNGGYCDTVMSLVNMNDTEDKSFAEIADYIEANL